MSLRFTSQLCIDNLPDEQLNNQFEVIMPAINIIPGREDSALNKITGFFSNTIYTYQPIVEEVIFGHKNFQLDTRRVRTGWFGVPKDIEKFHEVKLTMFCPASMETQYYLEAWRRLIFNEKGEYYYPFSKYKKNIEIYMYGPGGSLTDLLGLQKYHVTLQGCFPYQEKDWELEYADDPKRFRILATFNVDNVKVDTTVAQNSVIEGMITSPTSMLDKVLSGEGVSEYSIGETYGGLANNKSIKDRVIGKTKAVAASILK
jgi:hypothetical protein